MTSDRRCNGSGAGDGHGEFDPGIGPGVNGRCVRVRPQLEYSPLRAAMARGAVCDRLTGSRDAKNENEVVEWSVGVK